MRTPLALILSLASLLAVPAHAQLSQDQYQAEKKRISAAYKADRKACGAMEKQARKVCETDLKARRKVARAELDASVNSGGRAQNKLHKTQAKATLDVALQKCKALDGAHERQCKRDARAAHDLSTTGPSAPRERRS